MQRKGWGDAEKGMGRKGWGDKEKGMGTGEKGWGKMGLKRTQKIGKLNIQQLKKQRKNKL